MLPGIEISRGMLNALGYVHSSELSVDMYGHRPEAPDKFANSTRLEMCKALTKSDFLELQGTNHTLFIAVAGVSVLFSITVFLTTIWNSKLNQHPYSLVALIALIDAMFFLLFISLEHICTLDMDKSFAFTVYFSRTEDD